MKTVRVITIVGTIIALVVVLCIKGFDLLMVPVGMFIPFVLYTCGTLIYIIRETKTPRSYPKPNKFDKTYEN